MKKYLLSGFAALVLVSCIKQPVADTAGGGAKQGDVNRLQTAQEYQVPTKAGYVTTVCMGGDTLAEAVAPMAVLIPKTLQEALEVTYTPADQYPNEIENKAQLYQVVCFEDSRQGDYDYNDFVFHVKYQQKGNIFGFGVHPVALGSVKDIKLGCVVYKGNTQAFKGLITPGGETCRSQYFRSQEGFINTVGREINQRIDGRAEGWQQILGSTIRNWDISKIEGSGAMRVEWYIVVNGGTELYALSTTYLDQSFDKNGLPCGIVITETGGQYVDANGGISGKDWFNYPQESKSVKEVYPEIWEWLTTDAAYSFSDIYDVAAVPANAFPAANVGLYELKKGNPDVCAAKYLQN